MLDFSEELATEDEPGTEEDTELDLLDEIVIDDDELPTLELLLLDELGATLEVVAGGTEHSLMPPDTVLPAPKVMSLQIKLPFNNL